ncbi:MAG: ribonuclease M5 [Clostridia bacterium]|nr:ribonuclease M5 [Clostridia bacterium]
MQLKEIIVVEGRDDTAAIKRALDAQTIETHGFGIRKETWQLIAEAYNRTGIIVFTDPDFAGNEIRKRIIEKFPDALEAFLDRKDAEKQGDIGIENAEPEAILEALSKAHASICEKREIFSMEDMHRYGLTGAGDSSKRRAALGKLLGIGTGNTGAFLKKLNRFGIEKEELEKNLEKL